MFLKTDAMAIGLIFFVIIAFLVYALILYVIVKSVITDIIHRPNRELLEQIKLQNQLKIFELMCRGASAEELQEQIDLVYKEKSSPGGVVKTIPSQPSHSFTA